MNKSYSQKKFLRPISLLMSLVLSFSLLTGCGGGGPNASVQAPIDDSRTGSQTIPANTRRPEVKKGLNNTQKVAILAGAAALYYLYNKHKNEQAQGPQGKYYLSKNGRVYYRDAQKRAHWVTPPPEGIQVPEAEAQQYREYQGYNKRSTGRTLAGVGADPVPAQ